MIQIAWAASRTKSSYFNAKFKQLITRKGSKKALIAIARKIAVIAWNMLRASEPFNPEMLPIDDEQTMRRRLKYHQQIINDLQNSFEVGLS